MDKNRERFLSELKNFFWEKGLTQQKIADALGVSQSYVASLLNGQKAFGKKSAKTWSEKFGLSEGWLLTGEGFITRKVIQNNLEGDNYQGDGMTINKNESDLYALLKKRDEQIDRLLDIIQKMQMGDVKP